MDFIIPQGDAQQAPTVEKHVTVFQEKVYSENEQPDTDKEESASQTTSDNSEEEFDLSDISAQPQSREDIIAAAEEAAFKE